MKSYVFTDSDLIEAFHKEKLFFVPTDTVYGLAGIFTRPVLEKIRTIKQREADKALPVAVCDIKMAQSIAVVDLKAQKLIDAFLPGPLTLILPKKESVDPLLTNQKDTIAIRIPDVKPLLALIEQINQPLFLTSANLSGMPEAKSSQEVKALPFCADGIIEGLCQVKEASTIVDLTQDEIKILREGPIRLEQIEQVLQE